MGLGIMPKLGKWVEPLPSLVMLSLVVTALLRPLVTRNFPAEQRMNPALREVLVVGFWCLLS